MSTLNHAVELLTFTDREAQAHDIGVKRFAPRFRALLADVRRRAALRRAHCELLGMPDHLLKDLGVSRSEIAWIVGHGRSGRIRSRR